MVDIEKANQYVVDQMMEARPIVTRVGKAKDLIPGYHENLLLHAGPPVTWERMSGPVKGAMVGALIFEGRAKAWDDAVALLTSGKIEFSPCHHYASAGPMAGVVSPSMMVYEVENKTNGKKTFSGLNEGRGKVLRMGAYSEEVLARLTWMNDVLGPTVNLALEAMGGLDLRLLLAKALHMGDDGHNRLDAASLLYTNLLAPHIVRVAKDRETAAEVIRFLGDNALSILNPVMAGCKAMADAGHNVEGSTIVTTMARNGTDFGMRLASMPERWFTAPAGIVQGLYFPQYTEKDANPDIGDSTITETAGYGGMAMAAAPAITQFVGGTPQSASRATLEMYEITFGEHENLTIPALNFRGTPLGIDVRKVIETGILPQINTGIAHKDPGVGMVGAGILRAPEKAFKDAFQALQEM